jgi:hypothetical protein
VGTEEVEGEAAEEEEEEEGEAVSSVCAQASEAIVS